MTEKHYGGAAGFGFKDRPNALSKENLGISSRNKEIAKMDKTEDYNNDDKMEECINAGKIAVQARDFAVSIAKKDMPLKELAEKIEDKIIELGGKPAFPVNLSINEVAAHDTPSHDDSRKAHGLLKIDLGVHIDGFIADTAVSVDLENNETNQQLIAAAMAALESALQIVNKNASLSDMGSAIEDAIKAKEFVPIHNLSGHSIEQYDLHSGLTIPNYDTQQPKKLGDGLFAIEPFATNGHGAIRDGKPSGIYVVKRIGAVRDSFAREVLAYIAEEHISLPFCSRWIYKKFGSRGLLALRQIETAGIIYQYPQLIEKGAGIVAQAEHTVLIQDNKVIVTTK